MYNPTSPEEQQFMADFQKNWPAIQAFRAKYPKESLEGAYYKVTGKQWMPGRSVNLENGQPHMTKDRTVKSVLGKYVAPAALAAGSIFAGPELMGLLGMGGGGAGAAGTAAGTSMIGGAATGVGTGVGTALGTAGSLALPTITSLSGSPVTAVNAVPSLAGTSYSTGMAAGAPSIAGATGVPEVATGASKAGDFMSRFLGKKGASDNIADTAKIFGDYAGAQANNRSEMANLGQNYDSARLAAQQDQRTNESDAMRKLASSGYILGGGSQFKLPASLSLGGQDYNIPNLGLGPTPISDAERQGATTLQDQMLKRLQPGGSVQPTDPAQYAKQGFGEKVANKGSLILGGLSAVKNIFGF